MKVLSKDELTEIFENEDRKSELLERLKNVGIDINQYEVDFTDVTIEECQDIGYGEVDFTSGQLHLNHKKNASTFIDIEFNIEIETGKTDIYNSDFGL